MNMNIMLKMLQPQLWLDDNHDDDGDDDDVCDDDDDDDSDDDDGDDGGDDDDDGEFVGDRVARTHGESGPKLWTWT